MENNIYDQKQYHVSENSELLTSSAVYYTFVSSLVISFWGHFTKEFNPNLT